MKRECLFERDPDNRWYIVLPEWTGEREELEMVAGADKMLDVIAKGADTCKITMSDQGFGNADLLILTDVPESGGAYYLLPEWKGVPYNIQMWLCDVTLFVFDGKFPHVIYLE